MVKPDCKRPHRQLSNLGGRDGKRQAPSSEVNRMGQRNRRDESGDVQDGITPIPIGTAEALPPCADEDPEKEAPPSTPEPAKEDTIMAEPVQSTPEAGPKEEPFPESTPDLSTDLLRRRQRRL
jgi:hypothetical protein